jgi:phenylacetaldehyde dehydrogenase
VSGRQVLPPQRDLVDGAWVDPPRDGVALVHPDTGDEFARSAISTTETVDRAIAAAARDHAQGAWADRSFEHRAQFLDALAQRLAALADAFAFADALDSGVPIGVTAMFADALPAIVRDASSRAHAQLRERLLPSPGGAARLLRVPWGPAAVLMPFNAPAFTAVKKTAYALAAGCPVLLKPSPHAPHAANLLANAIAETMAEHGVPTALFQLLHGDTGVGARLASDPRVRCLTFTGSRSGGRAVARAAAGDLKALQLECGSNNAAIVRSDADIDATAASLVTGFTKLNGQWCERPGTLFVPASLHDGLLTALLKHLGELRTGSCLDPSTTFGPQANAAQAASVDSALRRLIATGARVHTTRTAREPGGCFRAPAVITGADPNGTLDEIFGPVLVLHAIDSDAQALEFANRLHGGLAAYVFGTDVAASMELGRHMAAGEVKINGTSVLDLSPDSAQSFWAGSGVGGHGDAELLRFFTGTRIVGADLPGAPI